VAHDSVVGIDDLHHWLEEARGAVEAVAHPAAAGAGRYGRGGACIPTCSPARRAQGDEGRTSRTGRLNKRRMGQAVSRGANGRKKPAEEKADGRWEVEK